MRGGCEQTAFCACGRPEAKCDGSRRACIERAFADGCLTIEVDEARPIGSRLFFEGSDGYDHESSAQVVHVISRPARGEIRGYVLTADGELHERCPRPFRWPALDAVIRDRMRATVGGAS